MIGVIVDDDGVCLAVAGDVGEEGPMLAVVGLGGPGLVRAEADARRASDGDLVIVDDDGVRLAVAGDVGEEGAPCWP